jgi:hypothetical protein
MCVHGHVLIMETAEQIAVSASGLFLMAGLVTGAWKYFAIRGSPEKRAHVYIDIAHRAALLYSFASLVLEKFVVLSELPRSVEILAVSAPIAFFAGAFVTYVKHGIVKDTDNQFRQPSARLHWAMCALIGAEIGGFAILLIGALFGKLSF